MAVPRTVPIISTDQVDGAQIYNTKGQHLGEIVDVVIDTPSGKPAYAVMSLSGLHCIVETYYPIPWSVLQHDARKRGYVVALDMPMLKTAPAYRRDGLKFDDQFWNVGVHDYYKALPYWN